MKSETMKRFTEQIKLKGRKILYGNLKENIGWFDLEKN